MIVYEDSGWRIRDLIGHIAAWDIQVSKSIEAFQAGKEYCILDLDEDIFNNEAMLQQRDYIFEQVLDYWEEARERFIGSIREVQPQKFSEDLLYPWGDERGSISKLVEYMIEHDEEHRAEIAETLELHS
jgi:hypothetical protein